MLPKSAECLSKVVLIFFLVLSEDNNTVQLEHHAFTEEVIERIFHEVAKLEGALVIPKSTTTH